MTKDGKITLYHRKSCVCRLNWRYKKIFKLKQTMFAGTHEEINRLLRSWLQEERMIILMRRSKTYPLPKFNVLNTNFRKT